MFSIRKVVFFMVAFLSFSLDASATGDCDGNGTVTISEVQSAINMFLGLNAPLLCVDEDSSGSVSISEVQKTINSFLGLTSATEIKLLSQTSIAGVSNNPPVKTTITLSGTTRITKMLTYHWNSGRGDTPGTLSLKDTLSGTEYGPWTATGNSTGVDFTPGTTWPTTASGPPYLFWIVQPNADVPAGTYELVDSKPATWAYTSDMGNKGYALIFGFAVSSQTTVWKAGTAKTYAIAETGVVDTLTGNTFRVSGGSGELKVTQIISGPDVTSADNAFKVDYKGSGRLQLVTKSSPDETEYLLGNIKLETGCLNGADERDWVPIPQSSSNGQIFFEIPATTALAKRSALTPAWSGIDAYKTAKVPKGLEYETLKATLEQKIRDVVINNEKIVPDSRKTKFKSDVNGELSPSLYVGWNIKSKDKYIPFYDIFYTFPACRIFHNNDSTINNVAHEAGHYTHHVLVGSSRFAEIAWNHRPKDHIIGTTGAKTQMIEDHAYFFEYYNIGYVGGNGSPEQGIFARNKGGEILSPVTTDMTDVEGFGVSMYAQLIRNAPEVRNYKEVIVKTPVFRKNLVDRNPIFKDITEIIAQGTDNLLDARTKIENLLTTYNEQDKLPAMLQPIGWTYQVKGKLVDSSGKEIAEATVTPVIIANGEEYTLPSVDSNSDGTFKIPEFFPGKSTLRVAIKNGSIETAVVTIPWEKPTNVEQDLGTVVINRLAPVITSLSPSSGAAGTQVTITGERFGFQNSGSTVKFNIYSISILSWSDTEIVVTIPTGIEAGDITVKANGLLSNGKPFTTVTNCFQKDTLTGLTWPLNGNIAGKSLTFTEAKAWVKGNSICGYSDWRLPTIDELNQAGPMLRKAPFINNTHGGYWSTNSCNTYNSNYPVGAYVMFLDDTSSLCAWDNQTAKNSLWPVRP